MSEPRAHAGPARPHRLRERGARALSLDDGVRRAALREGHPQPLRRALRGAHREAARARGWPACGPPLARPARAARARRDDGDAARRARPRRPGHGPGRRHAARVPRGHDRRARRRAPRRALLVAHLVGRRAHRRSRRDALRGAPDRRRDARGPEAPRPKAARPVHREHDPRAPRPPARPPRARRNRPAAPRHRRRARDGPRAHLRRAVPAGHADARGALPRPDGQRIRAARGAGDGMKALLRKELVQIVPAHVLVAVVLALLLAWILPPQKLLLPSYRAVRGDLDMPSLYAIWALVVLFEGMVLGMLQFGRERAAGTEAYLIHRGVGCLSVFAAKALAAGIALALVVATPPLLYGLWHVVLTPTVDQPLIDRLGHLTALGVCSLPGYAAGALVAQVHGRWIVRVILGMTGISSLVLAAGVASQPSLGEERTSIPSFVLSQLVLALGLLTFAYGLFRAGEDERRPWPGRLGISAAVAAVLLTWLPWIFIVVNVQQGSRLECFFSYPRIAESREGRIGLVTEVESRDG